VKTFVATTIAHITGFFLAIAAFVLILRAELFVFGDWIYALPKPLGLPFLLWPFVIPFAPAWGVGFAIGLVVMRPFMSHVEMRRTFFLDVEETVADRALSFVKDCGGGWICRVLSPPFFYCCFVPSHAVFVPIMSFLYNQPRSYFRDRRL
jgi:hypothetical protein